MQCSGKVIYMLNKRIFQNAKWIVLCRIAQSAIQLVVGMLTARYMGPANYGLINYASSIVAFFVPLMQLGLQSTLVQEYVEEPENAGKILGTSLAMNAISAVACIIGVISFAMIANRGEETTIAVCALYSISLFFQVGEMLQYWFQAQLMSKYSSLAMLFGYVAVSAYKIYLLASGKSVYWFALSHAVEYGVMGLLLLIAYKQKSIQPMGLSAKIGKKMLKKSSPYIAAALMEVVYNSTGNVLLKLMYGETENGYLAAAITCTCITGFVFRAIFDTARPVILESHQKSQSVFEKNVVRAYALTIWLSVAQSVFFTIFASLIMKVLYGSTYLPAIPALQIRIWSNVFSYAGNIRNMWILAEGKHKILVTINLSGAVVNILVNLCLIPIWGAAGAAMATLVTQFFTNVLMGFILKDIRANNRLMLRGLNPKLVFDMVAMIGQKK